MGTAKKDNLNLKTPSTALCTVSVLGEDVYDDLMKLVPAFKGGFPELVEVAEKFVNERATASEGIVKSWGETLKLAYSDMWDAASFYSGNFRDSIKLIGNFSVDPIECDIDFDMGNFTTPRTLPSLKPRVIVRTYKTKAGAVTKRYTYPPGTPVKITGEDYSERVPPTPFALEYIEEIKQATYKRKGF